MIKKHKLLSLLIVIAACSDSKVKEINKAENISISITKSYQTKILQIYTTAKDTKLRLTKTNEQFFKKKVQPLETEIAVFVNPKKTFQEYLGIGGAITDASAEVFSTLNNTQQQQLLHSLYGKDGIGYNII
jgi:glucosylceramidase